MKNKYFLLQQLDFIAQKRDPKKQVQLIEKLILTYAIAFKGNLKGVNEKNIYRYINDFTYIISKY